MIVIYAFGIFCRNVMGSLSNNFYDGGTLMNRTCFARLCWSPRLWRKLGPPRSSFFFMPDMVNNEMYFGTLPRTMLTPLGFNLGCGPFHGSKSVSMTMNRL